jgi:hypothetical protein
MAFIRLCSGQVIGGWVKEAQRRKGTLSYGCRKLMRLESQFGCATAIDRRGREGSE